MSRITLLALTFSFCLGCLFPLSVFADDDLQVRTLELTGLSQFGEVARNPAPVVLKTQAAVAEIVKDETMLATISMNVDFGSERLAFFRWQGSGQDKIESVVGQDESGSPNVEFKIQRGRTRDMRQHAAMFVVPNSIAIKGEQPEENPDFAPVVKALETWTDLKSKCGGNYSYVIRFSSFTGAGHATTITVADNQVVKRSFEKFDAPRRAPAPVPADKDADPKQLGWEEAGDALGSHPEGAPVKTLDEIYAAALAIAKQELKPEIRRYVRTNQEGLLTSCFTVDTRIMDDAPTHGIVISSIQLQLEED